MNDKLDADDEQAFFSETPEQATHRIIHESAPYAAQAIVELAMNASSENTRLRAATYVVDRILGPAGTSGDIDPLEQSLEELTKEANKGH